MGRSGCGANRREWAYSELVGGGCQVTPPTGDTGNRKAGQQVMIAPASTVPDLDSSRPLSLLCRNFGLRQVKAPWERRHWFSSGSDEAEVGRQRGHVCR